MQIYVEVSAANTVSFFHHLCAFSQLREWMPQPAQANTEIVSTYSVKWFRFHYRNCGVTRIYHRVIHVRRKCNFHSSRRVATSKNWPQFCAERALIDYSKCQFMPLFWLTKREAERNWSRQSIPDVSKIQYMLHSKRRTFSSVHVFAYLYTRSLRFKWMFSSTCLKFSLLCYLSFKALLFWVLIFFFSLLPAFHTCRLCFSFPVSVFSYKLSNAAMDNNPLAY